MNLLFCGIRWVMFWLGISLRTDLEQMLKKTRQNIYLPKGTLKVGNFP